MGSRSLIRPRQKVGDPLCSLGHPRRMWGCGLWAQGGVKLELPPQAGARLPTAPALPPPCPSQDSQGLGSDCSIATYLLSLSFLMWIAGV